jgi:hypothetical protein
MSTTASITRKEFLLAMPAAATAHTVAGEPVRQKVLIVVAHPDDEYAFAATTYRLSRETGLGRRPRRHY